MPSKQTTLALTLSALVLSGELMAAVDTAIPAYQKVSGVSGNLSSSGSDTLANLMTLWSEAYRAHYPAVNMQIQAAGSSTAPPALTEGIADFGPMSRKMKDIERGSFEQRHGYPPTAIPVAVDALAVFVHKDNPIEGLSLAQLDAIFSATRLCGASADVKTWGDLGVTGSLAARPIQLFGRNSVSGTYGYFKEVALCGGDFKARVGEQPGSASVVQAVGSTLSGIGYSGIGYRTAAVKVVALATDDGSTFVEASEQDSLSGRYPLSRFLWLYVNKAPDKPLPPAVAEFIRLILSQSGQQIVEKDGYVPLPAVVVEQARRELGL